MKEKSTEKWIHSRRVFKVDRTKSSEASLKLSILSYSSAKYLLYQTTWKHIFLIFNLIIEITGQARLTIDNIDTSLIASPQMISCMKFQDVPTGQKPIRQ